MRHVFERVGRHRFGLGTVPVDRCTRCGCGPDWPLAKADCPPGLQAGLAGSPEKAKRHTAKKAERRRLIREARAEWARARAEAAE